VSKYFAEKPEQPRARRAADAVAIGIGLLLLVWAGLNHGEISTSSQWFLDLLEPLPTWFDAFFRIGYFLGLLLVVVLFVAAILQKRYGLLRDMTIAAVAAVVVGLLANWLAGDPFPALLPELTRLRNPEAAFPIIRVAMLTAAIKVAAPQLTRPVRLLSVGILLTVVISGFGLGFGLPSDAIGGVAVGLITGGAALLLFGSPMGYPDVEEIATALSELGVPINGLRLVPDQSWGVRTLQGELDSGKPVEVLAYGRDAADSRMATRAWRALWYRESDRTISFSRLEAVEHDALAMLMAANHGVSSQIPLTVGMAGDQMALLARSADGVPIGEPTDDLLNAVWLELGKLHEAGMAHGRMTLDAITVDDGRVVLGHFTDAAFNATDAQKSKDVVSLLYETAVVVGAEAALAAAVDVVPTEQLIDALAYMQVPALSAEQRKRIDRPKVLLGELRDVTAAAIGVEVPEPAKLRRLRPKDLILPALSVIAVSVLLVTLAGVDLGAVKAVVRHASWVLIIIGFLVGQVAFFFEATAMLFATGYPLPMRPLVVLQFAVRWIGLAIPGVAGRVTMNTLFLRKYGVPATIAVTQGGIDGLAGFLVEALILLVAFVAVEVPLEIEAGDVRWSLILGMALLIGGGVIVAVLRIRRLHDLVIPIMSDAWASLSGVVASPKRLFGLLGSNVASRLILASTLWFILESIGVSLPLLTCLVVTVAANLLAGLVPIPGGIGVAEAVLTSFLVLAGLDADAAFAATVVYRLATFYLPAGQGFFATRWLEAGDYL
jgi:glycosyltransferase 2 family protein